MTVTDELQARALFEQRYGVAAAPVAVEIERRVIGAGATRRLPATAGRPAGPAGAIDAGLLRRALLFALRG